MPASIIACWGGQVFAGSPLDLKAASDATVLVLVNHEVGGGEVWVVVIASVCAVELMAGRERVRFAPVTFDTVVPTTRSLPAIPSPLLTPGQEPVELVTVVDPDVTTLVLTVMVAAVDAVTLFERVSVVPA
jgi:hypothetical protein